MSPFFKRQSLRLQGYDYGSLGAYFITICTKNREMHLGEISNGEMELSQVGLIVEQEWLRTIAMWQEVVFDEWVIMPNHFHALLWFTNSGELPPINHVRLPNTPGYENQFKSPSNNVSSLVRGFKGAVSRAAKQIGFPEFAWQRSFHDRIVRNDNEAMSIRQYIQNNPVNWYEDELFKARQE